MNNLTNKLIPELRFSEFNGNDTWRERKLAEILFEHCSLSTGKEEVFSVSVNKGIINQIEHLGRSFSAANTDNYNRVLPGDIIYTKSPTGNFPYGIIKQSRLSKDVIVSPLYGVFTPNTEELGYILDAYFESIENTNNYLSSIIQKGAKNTINIKNETFLSKSLVVPTDINEQIKISSLLSSLDILITLQADKLNSLKNHKKSLAQSLFPQEGTKIPKFRFKEFEKNREWEFLNGNNLFEPISNKNHNSDLMILAITQEHGAIPRNLINYNVVVTEKSIESYKVVEVGDFIISLRSFQGGIEFSNYKGICSPAYIILRKKNKYSENEFYKHYFKTDLYIRSLNKNLEGIRDGKMVSYSQFSEIQIPNPNPKEQKKIANTLSSIDELIKEQFDKIEQLKTHKKGLIQGLFPQVRN